jgi:hypothetical protein
MYYYGQGVPKNYAEAVKWFRKAAEQGYAIGQSQLGLMYERGQGVPQNYVWAHMWFNLAASNSASNENTEYNNLAIHGRDRVAAQNFVIDARQCAGPPQYSSASMMVSTRSVTDGSAGLGE